MTSEHTRMLHHATTGLRVMGAVVHGLAFAAAIAFILVVCGALQ